ncbi:trigger factor [Buchnera aphidicola]|uniref:Trigger factor n=1 Tax=Buchnera aphidicola str. USDA (Myzus persicae) TaxID=1009856 RepID=W0P4B7_BUCMP|nr:trigger factor [Buchnera aphidicola]AHG59923.1 Tig [Buchnera aphidicola str. USDA (Myzus persicae)]AHG60503.1 Tig [Buchnera aphidicola str. W106 (Myzus persicae)]AHG61076.1 Tig [Buchnera aphidicola str. G002 (Myzus persicae)]AHG61648.1 Tig [Buchnera aphidicola str. F009 (Myzus persicae)]WAI02837.1 MAG: trigger factor [Buchnera aphidicola (Myzus persicae)]
MKFFIEKNKDAGHRVTINIPKIIVNNAIFRELIKISKKTNMNGFRKGKIPIKVVQKKYGETIYYDVFKELMQKFFYEFIQKEKIKIIGLPKYYMSSNLDKEKEFFEYSVNYELYPQFEIKDIENIKVTKINTNITEHDIKKKIEEYQIKNNVWHIVNQPIKSYDRVTINYNIYEKNKKINKFNRENIIFIVSDNQLLSLLNHKIINHLTNDIIFLKVKLHPYHPEKELQNKEITFKIKIIKIEKRLLLESDEIRKKEIFTQKDHENIKYNLKNQINQIIQNNLEKQIIEEIVKKNPILLPPLLLKEEKETLYKQLQQQYKENNNLLEKKYYIDIKLKAKKRLYNKIILEKVISDNQYFKNEKNIENIIKNITLDYEREMKIHDLYNNKSVKNIIKNIALQKQALHWLIERVSIIKKNWTFDQFIKHKWENDEEFFA